MNFYAQIDDNGLVVGVSLLSGKVHHKNMIEIDSYDISLLGATYNKKTRQFKKEDTKINYEDYSYMEGYEEDETYYPKEDKLKGDKNER